MKKEILEQIEKIIGVKKKLIFVYNDILVVVFKEEKREPIFTTEDKVEIFENDEYWYLSEELDKVYFMNKAKNWFLSENTKRFSTEQAAKDWISVQNPKSLKPEKLVDGEIYAQLHPDSERFIFRFKSLRELNTGHHYSNLSPRGTLFQNDWLDITNIYPATLSEKQTLIRAEIKHRYFHELKNKK